MRCIQGTQTSGHEQQSGPCCTLEVQIHKEREEQAQHQQRLQTKQKAALEQQMREHEAARVAEEAEVKHERDPSFVALKVERYQRMEAEKALRGLRNQNLELK
jgi:hypothetical protein